MTEQFNNLKAAAEGYLNQGLSIVLMTVREDGKKGTLHTWKQWETRRQTRQEFDALPWLNAERFAVVCGFQGFNGLFFTPIDTDDPEFDPGLLRTTATERTPKGGHHFIYWSRINAKGKKLHDLKIELLGQGNLCLMWPSKDYVKVNDSLPTEIPNINEVFEGLAQKLGGHKKPRLESNKIRYCCREALTRDSHIEHLMRLAIASEYKRAGLSNEDIVQLFKSQDDYDHDKCLAQVESADPTKRARRETIEEYGYCYTECKEDCRKENLSEKENERMRETVTNLQAQFTFKTPDDIEEIYVFHEGIYEEAETMIKGLVEHWLGTDESTHFMGEVLGHIRRSNYVKRIEFNKPEAIIPVQNGLLNLNTLELNPFDKDKIFTFKSTVTYDKTKSCTKFLKAVSEWVDPQDVPLLQEISGYCLLPGMPFHQLFFLHGTGFNGKGSYIRTLQAILGKDHCSNLDLEEFDGKHRFAMARLYGKMINVSSEPRTDKDLQTSLVKKVSGEDFIDAEQKNKQKRLTFTNTAKPFILGNKFPKVNDNTIAFWERAVTLKFPSNFIGKRQIPTIWNTWINDQDEMSGILNWMIEGLHRLIKNNGFTKTKSSEETKIEFQKLSDTTGAFLNERCERFKEGCYIKRELYEIYKEYCDIEGLLDCDTLAQFSAKLKNIVWIKSDRIMMKGKREYVWIGLKVTILPTLPTLPTPLLLTSFESINKEESNKRVGSLGSLGNSEESLVCGHCKKWHTGVCSFPSDPNCVVPINPYAKTCPQYEEQEGA